MKMPLEQSNTIILFLMWYIPTGLSQRNYRKELVDKLLSNYSATIRPYCGGNDVINATIDVALRQVVDLDEPTQILKVNVWVRLEWTDCHLTWNPSDYNGIDNVGIHVDSIWTPDLTLYDGMDEDFHFNGFKDFRPVLTSSGVVLYNFPSIIKTRCIVDVVYFPFDTQTCKLVFGSWSHPGNEINIFHKYPKGDLSMAEQKVEYEVTQFPAERHVMYYNCCQEPYPDVTFKLKLERKPIFHIVHLIIPTVLITAMAGLGFLLPAESGEKVSLEMTVLLSLTVFQLVVADSLPSAASLPIIAIYFNICLILSVFATATAVLVLNVYYTDKSKTIPKVIRILFLICASKVVFVKVPSLKTEKEITQDKNMQLQKHQNLKELQRPANKISPEQMNHNIVSITDVNDNSDNEERWIHNQADDGLSIFTNRHEEKVAKRDNEKLTSETNEWKLLAKVLNRISFLIFILSFVFGSFGIFYQFVQKE